MGINFSNKLFTDKSLENFLYIDLIKKFSRMLNLSTAKETNMQIFWVF